MKKFVTKIFLIFIFLNFVFIPSAVNAAPTEGAGQTAAEINSKKELVILFTHDLHSYFLPHRILTEKGEQLQQGGYARLAYVIDEQRRLHPHHKTILVDAGDFSMGTLFHTSFMTEASELRLMGKMGYEVTTFGNHDFDFHPAGLAKMLTSARSRGEALPAIVASNTVLSKNAPGDAMLKKPFADYPVRDYIIIERNGLRIGLFGIIGKDAVHDTPFARPVTFAEQIEASKRVVDILKNKEKVDIVICLSHSGTFVDKSRSEDEILAETIPQIDIIISGHTHTVLPEPIIIGKTIIVSSGKYSEYLGVLAVSYEKQNGVALMSYQLKNISTDVPEDKAIASEISRYKEIVNQNFLAPYNLTYDDVIAESDFSMESIYSAFKKPREMGLGNLITDAYRAAIKQAEGANYQYVHVAMQPLGLIRDSFQKGKITVADVFQVLSLGIGPDGIAGYPLVSFYVSGGELKDILEVHTTIAPLKKRDAYLQVSGVKFTYNPRRVWFDRVTSVEVQDGDGTFRPLDQNKLYRVCANLYTATLIDYVGSASHGLIKVLPKDQSGKPLPDLKSAIVYIKKPEELKEWLALTLYLRSFKDTDGLSVPRIPERYSKPEGRYLAQPSLNPVKLFGGGNIITYSVLLAGMGLLLLCGLIVYFVVRKIRKK
ncbi:MAG: bifunctional metallophosphatase/5'-nucleotidase [Deltaproteobacteria bacterium HGW-Deltaproteobacteria-13]|jgi:2',3'-cyclic-nucleotide 2'-phosphodiesterase (5'-nucleotidase family)|nr:MAG: bifunctional metallophosphatase/5'-nucleotidase [Deltaproteobacteria bacterium HGW-Deltaproteobacteria-13]